MLDYSNEYFEKTLHNITAKISADTNINHEDAECIMDYLTDMRAGGIGASRLSKCAFILKNLAVIIKQMGTTFKNADEKKLKQLVIGIDMNKKHADWTKRDHKVILKKFYKWLLGNNEEYPKLVKWIRTPTPKNKILPEYLLTEEDVLKMVNAAGNLRDKALIFLMYESGARVSEILSLQLKDITFGEHLTSIQVKGKTGQRRIPLYVCTAYISNWINIHPFKDNPEAYLWCTLYSPNWKANESIGRRLTVQMLRNVAKKAGVNKRVNPHTFRHSRATHLAKKLTEAQLKQLFGWTQSSDMASQYVHLSGRDLDNAVLGLYGIQTEEEKSAVKISQKKCPRCEMFNPSNFMLCRRCGSALNDESAMNVLENKHEQSLSVMSEVINQFKELENKGFDLQQFSKFMESWAKSNGGKHEP